MTCICMDGSDADYFMEPFYSFETIARSRKTCCECGRVIMPGERYENARGKEPGELQHPWHKFATCSFCLAVIRDFSDCGRMFGQLWDYMWEELGIGPNGEELEEEHWLDDEDPISHGFKVPIKGKGEAHG